MKNKIRSAVKSTRTLLYALLFNFIRGFRTSFFLRVDARSWVATPGQFIAAVAVLFGVDIALSRTMYDTATFYWGGFRSDGFDIAVLLMVGWLSMRASRKRVGFLLIPLALIYALLTVDVVEVALYHLTHQLSAFAAAWAWYILYYVAYLWLILIAVVLVKRTTQTSARRAFLVVTPMIVLLVYGVLVPSQRFWYPKYDEAAEANAPAPSMAAVTEEMLYSQPRLADSTLASLLPNRPGVADLYFVGFAPYADQDVFMKEGESLMALMDERFDTHGRSMLLVNNDKTLRQYPLATVTNLRAAFTRLAKLMSKDEDVLVLYLTSHGSSKHKLSAEYWPLKLDQLDPAMLKAMLDESGIKWRVVIVSACYAGGYVEPLRGSSTVVMTAADATHTSFGCDSEADFTYFGKALIDEQLRQTHSFEEAFAKAVPTIREREKGKQDEFSNPQIAVGSDIRTKLQAIEYRLAKLTVTDSDTQLQSRLVGNWREKRSFTERNDEYDIVFQPDGKFEVKGSQYYIKSETPGRFVWRGKWGVSRRKLWYVTTFSDRPDLFPIGERFEDRILSVSASEWRMIEQSTGGLSRASRVR